MTTTFCCKHSPLPFQLISSDEYSSRICATCHDQLKTSAAFKTDLIQKQQEIYKFSEDEKITDASELLVKLEEGVGEPMDNLDSIIVKCEPMDYDEDFANFFNTEDDAGDDNLLELSKKKECKVMVEKFKVTSKTSGICPICGVFKRNLKHHVGRTHQQNEKLNCDRCPKFYFINSELQKHMRAHDLKDQQDALAAALQCSICHHKFSSVMSKKIHIKTQHDDKVYECNVCQEEFISKHNLRMHKSTHREQTISCRICDASQPDKLALKQHIAETHETQQPEEKSWVCEICGSVHPSSYDLKTHQERTHDEFRILEVPQTFQCVTCEKSFIEKDKLSTHIALKHKKNKAKVQQRPMDIKEMTNRIS